MPKQESTIKLSGLNHVCIAVKDMDRAIEYHSSHFGFGPFNDREVEYEYTYRGKQARCRVRVAHGQAGPIQIQFVEAARVLGGETLSHPFTDFLSERGEGVQHLGFEVSDLDGMLAKLANEGIEPVFRVTLPDMAIAFLNTDKIGGVQFELMELRGGTV